MHLKLVADINEVLANHGIAERILGCDITLTDKTVTDFAKMEQRLSSAVIESIWPRIRSGTFNHYTSRQAAESILSERILRLSSISKRFSDDEIKTFCDDHQLTGYLERGTNGQPVYQSLIMPNTFYASLTEQFVMPEEEEAFWSEFSYPDGVCLTFDVSAENPNFRKIVYQNNPGVPIPVLQALSDCISKYEERKFILSGISRLCAFYLKGSFSGEMEHRMLHRVWDNDAKSIKIDPTSNSTYIEIPLGPTGAHGFKMEVVRVKSRIRPTAAFSCAFVPRV